MKPTNVAALSALGMLLTSVSVYSFTPTGGFTFRSASGDVVPEVVKNAVVAAQTEPSRFNAGGNVMLEGRLGHAKLVKNSAGETFVMLEVRGSDTGSGKSAAPVNVALVIDRSGSMKGTRIKNAISAATSAVDRLSDGDVVSVVTFDTRTQVVVPPTTIGVGARERVNTAIRGITLGGDTCISCGIDEAMTQLAQTTGKVNRMLLLSDGDANHGVRDIVGFRGIGQRAQQRGVSVTTIGVDVDFNEKIMSVVAQESNGRHYFAPNDAALPRIFEQEAENLTRSVASNVEAVIDLAPGVTLDRVFDRSARVTGRRVVVPLGSFAASEVKTVLLKVRAPMTKDGVVTVADVDLTYRDLVSGSDGRCGGKLGVEVVADASRASELDEVVNGRVQRSETAATLKDVNTLFEQGKVDEARRRLATREESLRAAAAKAKQAPPAARAADVKGDFDRQIAAVDDANKSLNSPEFATPPPGAAAPAAPVQSRAGKSAVKQNAERALDLAF